MVVDRVERDLVQETDQLALVLGAQSHELSQLHACHEGERALAWLEQPRRPTRQPGDCAIEGDEGDRHPCRPVGELVLELVEGLVELVGAQGSVEALALARHQRRLGRPDHLAEVGVQEPGAHPVLPRLGPRPEALPQPGVVAARFETAGECNLRGVGERSEHPGHVLEHALLGAALRQRARGLALEVQDGETLGGAQELTQVVVPVNANLHEALGREGLEPLQLLPQTSAVVDDPLRDLAGGGREPGKPGGERSCGAAELGLHLPQPPGDVGRGDWLGRQRVAWRGRGEGSMEAPGQRAQASGLVRIGCRQGAREHRVRRLLAPALDRGGVVFAEPLQGGRPRVALARHELVQHGQRHRLGAIGLVGDGAGEPRGAGECCLARQEIRELELGARAGPRGAGRASESPDGRRRPTCCSARCRRAGTREGRPAGARPARRSA